MSGSAAFLADLDKKSAQSNEDDAFGKPILTVQTNTEEVHSPSERMREHKVVAQGAA